ncbi:hypothetical protein NDU88_005018 [Pleurodeles waltl]|uniref:Uncharacterized protein n=1 Tax=Pleurodeles waltl TaxID=8319 RepID=A0AAV7VMC7_PLEWA|nr:hypothetical protein NDU88_005018 [Pleurodeles waltl]
MKPGEVRGACRVLGPTARSEPRTRLRLHTPMEGLSLGNIPGSPQVIISGNDTWFPSSRFFSPGPRDQEMAAFTVKLDLSVPV